MNKQIKNKILKLSPNKQLLFGISCVKRMEANLLNYLISNGEILSSSFVSKLIEKVYNSTLNKFNQINETINASDIELIEQLIPDTDIDGGSDEVVLAQNAAIALAYCIDFIKDNNADFITYCSLKVIETVDVLSLENSDAQISEELAIQGRLIDIINDMVENNFDVNFDKLELLIAQTSIVKI